MVCSVYEADSLSFALVIDSRDLLIFSAFSASPVKISFGVRVCDRSDLLLPKV